ncbi:HAD family hydrolase [Saccharopolyspora endophytica]|uniref:HAD family hydrolase n=2 Tax=Saccharopolyspora endophytica TaxID=543886 RepID=A0ABS5D9Y0_9PSEU|nr:HAD family hydrolase [Saccharopolyspora endophytica]
MEKREESTVPVRAVVCDVGETLVDDTRFWRRWARWFDIPEHTMSALVGAMLGQGRDNAEAFTYVRGQAIDLAAERQRREHAGMGEYLDEDDLYPDVRDALSQLRDAGIWIGIAGNQTRRAGELVRALNLPVDAIATSEEWGVTKPDLGFFERIVATAPCEAGEIVYVGDHPDHDIRPAARAGLRTAHVRRGPLGYLYADAAETLAHADWRVDSLTALADILAPAR